MTVELEDCWYVIEYVCNALVQGEHCVNSCGTVVGLVLQYWTSVLVSSVAYVLYLFVVAASVVLYHFFIYWHCTLLIGYEPRSAQETRY